MTELFRNTFGTRTVPTRSMSGTRMEHEGVATSAGPSQGLGPECDGLAVCCDVHASILAQVYGWRNGRSKTPIFCNDSGQILSAALRTAASLVSSLQSFAQPSFSKEGPRPSLSRDSGQALTLSLYGDLCITSCVERGTPFQPSPADWGKGRRALPITE